MENFQWLTPLKCSVLMMFFVAYAAMLAIVMTGRTDDRWASMATDGETEQQS